MEGMGGEKGRKRSAEEGEGGGGLDSVTSGLWNDWWCDVEGKGRGCSGSGSRLGLEKRGEETRLAWRVCKDEYQGGLSC